MDGALFISYSHIDLPWMETIRKHLVAMLHERCTVWTDFDIPPGSSWESKLLSNLNQASAALVLASPDYLVSPWCRRELTRLEQMRKSGLLKAVYWMLLRPCGWQRSELADFQAVQSPATRAISDVGEGPARDNELLRCCNQLASDLLPRLRNADDAVTMVRELLSSDTSGGRLTVHSVLGGGSDGRRGDFAVVCLGNKDSGEQVVIKVLVSTPLHRLRDLFYEVGRSRRAINHPAALPTDAVLRIGEGFSQRIVIVSERARGVPLSHFLATPKGDGTWTPAERNPLDIDAIGRLLRQLADLLQRLHELPTLDPGDGSDEPYVHVQGPLSPHDLWYDEDTRLPQLALLGVTNFLWHFFDPVTYRRLVRPTTGVYQLPHPLHTRRAATVNDTATAKESEWKRATRLKKADQYFLGMLALELLEGRSLYVVGDNEDAVDPRKILMSEPRPAWALRHGQLFGIIDRLLQVNPDKRYDDMDEVVWTLSRLEDSPRALAKQSFLQHLTCDTDPGRWTAFSKAFYARFFADHPEVRATFAAARHLPAEATAGFEPDDAHHAKLMDGLKAVLNFRIGGRPTAVDSLATSHVRYKVSPPHLLAFQDSFIESLRDHLKARGVQHGPAEEVVQAWLNLFKPVVAEMQCTLKAAEQAAHPPVVPPVVPSVAPPVSPH